MQLPRARYSHQLVPAIAALVAVVATGDVLTGTALKWATVAAAGLGALGVVFSPPVAEYVESQGAQQHPPVSPASATEPEPLPVVAENTTSALSDTMATRAGYVITEPPSQGPGTQL